MNKAYVQLEEMPKTCFECPFRYEEGKIPLGNFTYQSLFRCRLEPEDLGSAEEDEVDAYLDDIINKKPDWCPIKNTVNTTHEHNYDNCRNITCKRKSKENGAMEFLITLECVAIKNGFRLCMERDPNACGIIFYYIDLDSRLRSSNIHFDTIRECSTVLFDRLNNLAVEFRTRLDENKSSFETGGNK